MRTVLTVAAVAVLVFCGFQIYGGAESDNRLYLMGFVLAGVYIVFEFLRLGRRSVKRVVEQTQMTSIETLLADATTRLSKLENERDGVRRAKEQLQKLQQRVSALKTNGNDLLTLRQTFEAQHARLEADLSSLEGASGEAIDPQALNQSLSDAASRVKDLERAARALPGLREHTKALEARVTTLQETNPPLEVQISDLTNRIDALLLVEEDDDTGETSESGSIVELEAGDSRFDEVLPEQVDSLASTLETATGRVDTLESAAAKLPKLSADLDALEARVAPLEHATDGVVELIGNIRGRLVALFDPDNESGTLFDLVKGDQINFESDLDVQGQVEWLEERKDKVVLKIEFLEQAAPQLTKLKEGLDTLRARVEPLEDTKTGLLALLEKTRELVVELYDKDNDSGVLYDILQGDTSMDGNLEEQVTELREKVDEVVEKLDTVATHAAAVATLARSFARAS